MDSKSNDLIQSLSTVQSMVRETIRKAKETKMAEDRAACETAVRRFVEEVTIKCPGNSITARKIHQQFVLWHVQNYPYLVVPSQKIFGALLRIHGLKKEKRGGLVKYLDLSLVD
jgi:hypothetical protein